MGPEGQNPQVLAQQLQLMQSSSTSEALGPTRLEGTERNTQEEASPAVRAQDSKPQRGKGTISETHRGENSAKKMKEMEASKKVSVAFGGRGAVLPLTAVSKREH